MGFHDASKGSSPGARRLRQPPSAPPLRHTIPSLELAKSVGDIKRCGVCIVSLSPGVPLRHRSFRKMSLARVVGVDIGIRNLSVCSLEIYPGGCGGSSALERAITGLRESPLLDWEVCELCPPGTKNVNRCSHAVLLDGMVSFVRSKTALFAWATHVVIEAQPNARMKMLSGALYALLRSEGPPLRAVVFHPARNKLTAWGSASLKAYAPEVKQKTYSDRKRGAVALMSRLLLDSGAHDSKLEALSRMRKKDDAADSFLHALSFAVCLRCVPNALTTAPWVQGQT